ncbi:MAG: DUF1801 domain-containing protein [Oscillospiraceae bacterium]|jgi:uncharacterized protein YdhG (YjbR/CyaY superfamily)|nr:DUF1801 domain-containing protein [Oscillospiraceae bacterium]
MTTIDEYIAAAPEEHRATLQKIRETVRAAAPKAVECISYGMPAYRQGEVLIYFAAMKRHIGIYPTASGMAAFADRLSDRKTSKGAIQLPYGKPVPYHLIAEITRFRLDEVAAKGLNPQEHHR